MPSFLIHETFIREYEVEAADIHAAYEIAVNENLANYTEHSEGVTYVREVDGSSEIII